jgi:hypothetical protein
MKRIFVGITYILLLVMMFTCLLVNCVAKEGEEGISEVTYGILAATSYTGLPVIGFVFIFPAFVFTIIAICNQKKISVFLRDMFSLFASVFVLASVVIAFFMTLTQLYAPVILALCSGILFAFSTYGVIRGIHEESKKENRPQFDIIK